MIVAIAGGTGSGKTTLSYAMKKIYTLRFNANVEIVSMDNYYKNENIEKFDNYDHPKAFNMTLLYNDLKEFLSTGNMQVRSYDYVTKESTIIRTQSNVKILILEGLYPYYEKKIRDICSIKLYLDIDEDTRIKRRLLRDLQERNISIEKNTQMIDSFVKEMHKKYVSKQKKKADKLFKSSENILEYL
ncbi:hypothetical protein [Sulfurimonas sp.]|uniref:uridine kinase family protein n=1 Tax=Sulfurimonas sp. TaxID=2022749 RepID=UPI0025E3BE07|nr:hypothetical protein [Sulfurimonas sp.]